MSAPVDLSGRWRSTWRQAGIALCLLLAALAVPAAAQDTPAVPAELAIEALATRVQVSIANPEVPIAELEALREDLVRARAAAQSAEAAQAPAVAELRTRLDALGPPPAEGESEAPEVARLRQELTSELNGAHAPVLVAQEAARRASSLVVEVDRVVRSRIAAERYGHGPLPILPSTWTRALAEVAGHLRSGLAEWQATRWRPADRPEALRHLPIAILLATGGVLAAFTLRRSIGNWIERRLARAQGPHVAGRLLFLRSLNRIVLPMLGAALIFAGIDVALFGGRPGPADLVALLPPWVMSLIVAGWLAGSFFAPRAPAFRIAPLDTPAAESAAKQTLAGGAVLALHFVFGDIIRVWQLAPDTQAVLGSLVVIAGALVLWRAAHVVDRIAATLGEAPVGPAIGEETGGRIGWWLLRQLVRALRLIAVVAPLVAAVGYVAGAEFVVVAALLTLALTAAGVVTQDLVSRAVTALAGSSTESGDGGLIPVIVGLLVTIACLPLFALVWGARTADIRDAWAVLIEGVSVGGMTISLNVVLSFLFAFAIVAAVTRLIQSLLVGSVLPRTKLDTGAREAARAGVGYVGFALAVVAGIGAAGLDLSNLALVAGALSVGIGFGLQTVVSNFVSGIILLVERPIKPGDWIEVGGNAGYVRGIRVRSTEIETFDRASVIIPNSELIAGTVLNRTHLGLAGRLVVPVSVSYNSDPREVERLMLAIVEEHPLVLEDPPPAVVFLGFGADGINFELRCRLRDVNFVGTVRSDVNFAIFERFRAAGIVFPFPQREVHIVSDTSAESGFPSLGIRSTN